MGVCNILGRSGIMHSGNVFVAITRIKRSVFVAINCTFSGSTTQFFVITESGIFKMLPSEVASTDIVCTKDGFESCVVPRNNEQYFPFFDFFKQLYACSRFVYVF